MTEFILLLSFLGLVFFDLGDKYLNYTSIEDLPFLTRPGVRIGVTGFESRIYLI